MQSKRTNPDFLNGVPELLILHLLSRQPLYGYQLAKEIRRASDEAFDFGEGCIYPVLHRLESDGVLSGRRTLVGGRSRVVYRLTSRGAARLAETRTAWRHVVEAVERVLQGGQCGKPALA
jgi:PadR family transcriptional regulator, regulatory protein PadR